ncbi:MAG: RNA polymerase sigma factor [Acidimicrobiia bacterium]|nr:RNA polymerase sigma factor [Acidimicrobiia bacterium]NNL69928.1 RNA polymerase sigma factor [Acidimicrobiia bacterium]
MDRRIGVVKHKRVLADRERRLIHDLYPSLRRFAAVVGPVDVEPDDLVQEALFRALRHGPLTDLTFPTAYLKRCILNLSKDQVRSIVRRRRAVVALAATTEAFCEAYPSDVVELMELPPQTRAVLYLREIEGRPFGEIGEIVGCTEKAARNRASRGRKRLRRILEETNATT